jgi:hypothetical protein
MRIYESTAEVRTAKSWICLLRTFQTDCTSAYLRKIRIWILKGYPVGLVARISVYHVEAWLWFPGRKIQLFKSALPESILEGSADMQLYGIIYLKSCWLEFVDCWKIVIADRWQAVGSNTSCISSYMQLQKSSFELRSYDTGHIVAPS